MCWPYELSTRPTVMTGSSTSCCPACGGPGTGGLQLTWTDAKVGDWVVTPRIGKPVEINALWYNALRTVAAFLAVRREVGAQRYATVADRVLASFQARFVRAD